MEFNENPYKKDTPIVPFANATGYEIWHSKNCKNCIKYECESANEEEAKCKLAYHIDFGTITGTIPLWVAKEVGCDYNPLYGFASLDNCRQFRTGEEPF